MKLFLLRFYLVKFFYHDGYFMGSKLNGDIAGVEHNIIITLVPPLLTCVEVIVLLSVLVDVLDLLLQFLVTEALCVPTFGSASCNLFLHARINEYPQDIVVS